MLVHEKWTMFSWFLLQRIENYPTYIWNIFIMHAGPQSIERFIVYIKIKFIEVKNWQFFVYNLLSMIFYNLWILKKGDIFPKTKMNLVVLSAAVQRSLLQNLWYEKERGCRQTAATPLDALKVHPQLHWVFIKLMFGEGVYLLNSHRKLAHLL